MPNTPTYALPYPLESDTADVPRDIQALATRLDTVLPGVGIPTGGGMDWYSATPPSGFLLCDGSAVSRTSFAALYAVLGTTWGGGDGSTTFNLPDLRGRVIVGYAPGGHAEVAAIAGNDGTALAARRVRHAHTIGLTATPSLSASHNLSLPDHGHALNMDSARKVLPPGSGGVNLTQNAEHSDLNIANGSVGSITSAPGINGGISVGGSVSIGGTVGVTGGTADGPSYVVAAKVVKT